MEATGTLKTMPFYLPRKQVEFEIDAHNANYSAVKSDIKKICADHQNCELHIKVFNLQPTFGTDCLESQDSKAE